jgi:hypothetical protein
MGNRQDDRSSRMGTRNVGPSSGGGRAPDASGPRGGRGREAPPLPQRGEPGRAFDRSEDMGGSQWSGASGRGGYGDGGGGYGASQGEYGRERDYARVGGVGYANEGRHEGRHEDHDGGGFLSEDTPGHVPNQRWSGGYGAARDRDRIREGYGYGPSGPPSGRGFTGNDFGGLPPRRDRSYGAPADLGPRHFGNKVDRGGRMGWSPEPSHGPHGGGSGSGFHGTDMGMGMPDEERGPHYGKGPKGYKRSDERTREDVCDAIAHQGFIDASDVEVKVEDGVVTLSGTVAQRNDKRKLEHLAELCRGVHEVHNELRLERGASTQAKPQERQESQDKLARPAASADSASNGHNNGTTARSS